MSKRMVMIVLFVVMALVFANPVTEAKAAEKPEYGGTVTIVFRGDVSYWDPYRYSPVSQQAQSFYLERGFIGDWSAPRDKVSFQTYWFPVEYSKGQLAESWETPDSKTLIMHLKKGVRWHNKPPMNGREVTSDDFVYSFGRMLGRGIGGFKEGSPYRKFPRFDPIQSIEAPDKYTVIYRMTEGALLTKGDLIGGSGQMFIVPREVIEKHGDITDWKNATGTGPFILDNYVSGSSIRYVRNPNYYIADEKFPELKNKVPYVDEVKVLIIEDMSTEMAAFRTGKIDVIGGLTWEQKDDLRKKNKDLKVKGSKSQAWSLGFRTDLKPFTDIRVRKALQMAIDLKAIAEDYYGGNASTFPSLNGVDLGPPHFMPLKDMPKETQAGFAYNPEGAKKLLAQAGFPKGFKTNIETRGSGRVDLLELVQTYFAQVGVTLEIRANEYAAGNAIYYGRKTTAMFWGRQAIHAAPHENLMYWYKTTPWNWGNVDDPYFNTKFEAMGKTFEGTPEYNALSKEMNKYGTGQFWGVGMPVEMTFDLWWPWLKSFNGERQLAAVMMGPLWARIWIDTKLKKSTGH